MNYTNDTFETKLDHFNTKDDRTFNLRYWQNDKYASSDSNLVFLYICGEWTCSPPADDAAAMAFGAR